MPARKTALDPEALRVALLDAAGMLLQREGPQALSVRRLADAVGTSTQAIYTQFGGKLGVVRAMYREGFARLAERMGAVPIGDDPIADIHALGEAYRDAARARPHFYNVMFGRAVPEFECTDEDRAESIETYLSLVAGVQRAVDAGRVDPPADLVAAHLWLCVHGHVSLELAGYLNDAVDYTATLRHAVAPFLRYSNSG